MNYKNVLLLVLSSSLLFFLPSLVRSESGTKEMILDNRAAFKETLQIKKEERVEAINAKKETFKEMLQVQKEERKTKMEQVRESFKEKRAEFKEKIETIKDERKKQLTEKIDNRMTTVNKNQTDRMLKALERLTEHVNKLEERIVKTEENSAEVSAIEKLIETAKTAISDAMAIVEEQAAKDYAFTITDEANLGQSIKASYDVLSSDLKKAQESLVKAKEAVVSVYKAVLSLEKITPTPTVTAP